TSVRAKEDESPQPHISAGYSPIAPMEPKFNTSRDLRSRFPALAVDPRRTISTQADFSQIDLETAEPTGPGVRMNGLPEQQEGKRIEFEIPNAYSAPSKKKRGFLAKFAAFIVFIGVFGGILYGTHTYLKSQGLLPNIIGPKQQTGTVSTDVNLRPAPNTN